MELYELIPGRSEYEPFVRALNVYVHILNSFEDSQHKARNQGETYQAPGKADEAEEVDKGGQEASGQLNKQQRSRSVESPDEAIRRCKIDVKVFAWVIRDMVELLSLSPALRQTQATLENFSRDSKYVSGFLFMFPFPLFVLIM